MLIPVADFIHSKVEFTEAFRQNGICALVNHGIDSDLLDKKEKLDRQLFSLPDLAKYPIDPETRDRGGYYRSSNENDTRHLWQVVEEPERNYFPNELPSFVSVSVQLLQEYKHLYYSILALIERSLRIPDKMLWHMVDSGIPLLCSWECHKKIDIPNPPKFRVEEHTDSGLLTLMPIPREPGLQVFLNTSWIPVLVEDFPPHTLLVLACRTLDRIKMSGIVPCWHRVVWMENKRITSLFGVRMTETS